MRLNLKNEEIDLLSDLSWGFVLLVYLVSLFLLVHGGRFPKSSEEATYVFSLSVFPLIAPLLARFAVTTRGRTSKPLYEASLGVNLLFLVGVSIYIVLTRFFVHVGELTTLEAGLGFIGMPLLHAGSYFYLSKTGKKIKAGQTLGLWFCWAASVFTFLIIFFEGSFDANEVHPFFWHMPDGNSVIMAFFMAAAITFVFQKLRSRVGDADGHHGFFWGLAAVAVILSFDPFMGFDYYHHTPWGGAGLRIAHGEIPLVGSFNQYGPGPALIWGLFFRIFNFSSLYVSGLTSAVWYVINGLVFTTLVFRVVKNSWLAFAGVLLAVWFHHLAPETSVTMSPSDGWGRYFPDLVLLLAFTTLKPGRRYNVYTILALCFAGIWSIEIFGFCVVTAMVFFFCRELSFRNRLRDVIKWTVAPVGLVLVQQVLVALFVRFFAGSWPNYSGYWGIIHSHVTNTNVSWLSEISPDFYSWIFYYAAYFAVFAFFWRSILVKSSGQPDWSFLTLVIPAATLGIVEATYFVGRSPAIDLVYSSWFPLFFLCLVIIDKVGRGITKERLTTRVVQFISTAVAVALLTIMVARLNEPLSAYRSNASLLRWCFSSDGCNPARLYTEMHEKLTTPTYRQKFEPDQNRVDPGFGFYSAEWIPLLIRETVGLFQKNTPDAHYANIFMGEADEGIFFYTKKEHMLTISNPMNDSLSQPLIDNAVAESEKFKQGEVVYYHPAIVPRSRIDLAVLNSLMQKWKFCELDRSEHGVLAVRLTNLAAQCPTRLF